MLLAVLTVTQLVVVVTASTGVNFVPLNDFYSTYSMWALSFSIDIRPYYDSLSHLNDTTVTLKDSVTKEFQRSLTKIRSTGVNDSVTQHQLENEIFVLKVNMEQQISTCKAQTTLTIGRLFQTLDDLRDLYTHTTDNRKKRSLLPWAGDLLGSLFGVATKTDLARLRQQLNSLSANEDELVHVVENSLTIVNKTNAIAANNRRAINILNEASMKLSKKMRSLHNIKIQRDTIQNLRIGLTNKILGMTNAIFRATDKIKTLVDRLSNDLNQALRNHLSTTLVSPDELRKALNGISKRIPNSLTLKDYDGHAITWYYKHLPITIIPDQDKIHLVSVIPLIPIESLYTLFRVIALPVPIAHRNRSSQMTVEGTHFAVSRQGNSYVVLDEDELSKCSQTDTTYCPLNHAAMSLARMPSCLSSLYMEEKTNIIKNCPVKITNTNKFPMFQHLIKGTWMVATRDKLTVHYQCGGNGEYTESISITPPVQTITLPPGCTGYTEYGKLPPYFYRTTDESQSLTNYGKLNIGKDLDDIWELVNSNYTYDYKLINDKPRLFEMLPEADNADITRLQERLHAISKNKIVVSESGNWYGVALVVVAIGIACIGLMIIVMIVVYRLKVSNKKSKFDLVNVSDEFEMIDVSTNCETPSGSTKSPVQLKPAFAVTGKTLEAKA